MTKFPGGTKVLQGAIVGVDQLNLPISMIIFRYNTDTKSRTLKTHYMGECGTASEAMLLLEEGISPTPEERLLSSTKPVFEVRF